MKQCPKCNTEHNKLGIFCSRSCANSRIWSEEDKKKKSEANKGNVPWHKGKKVPMPEKQRFGMAAKAGKRAAKRFEEGLVSERSALRKHIANRDGYFCAECGIEEYNNKPIMLQVDHMDGNASNNSPKNLRLLCPNCHSQQDNWGARNKGKGRAARGLPLR
ncbi:MAG: HNH endonuclease [Richelia sp. RM2_1_2]|nr:HNH endonuclease [Richelia sp. RM2_1_2]